MLRNRTRSTLLLAHREHTPVKFTSIESLRDALQAVAQDMKDPFIIINADAKAAHQSVITVMEAARLAGHSKITFTTETAPQE